MSMTWSKTKIILICIVAIGLLVRVVGFPHTPPELNRDEAALGYNAYTLLTAGKDEWGVSWPIVFRSFGDYKLPGYIYTLIPFIQIFGLTSFAVRLPSLIAGVWLIVVTYILVHKLFRNNALSLLSAGTVAIAPWAIHYSHVGFEANLALALFISAWCLVLDRRSIHVLVGTILFFCSFLTYNAPLLLMPFLLPALFVWKKISWKQGSALLIAFILAFVLVIPATKGKTGISIFTDPGIAQQQREQRVQAHSMIERIQTQPLMFYTTTLTRSYIQHMNPSFLVTGGGRNPWHQAPGTGHLFWTIYIFMVTGCIALVIQAIRSYKKGVCFCNESLLLFLWLIAPIPSVITVDAPHATRSLLFLLLSGVVAAYGLWTVVKERKIWIYIGFVTIELFLYMCIYLTVFPYHPQPEWNMGMKEAVVQANAINKSETITVVGDPHYDYMYMLFYLRIPFEELQQTRELYPKDTLGFTPVKKVGRFEFVQTGTEIEGVRIVREESAMVLINDKKQ